MTMPSSTAPRAWYVLSLFILLYAFSFVDRYIIALLAEPLSRDLNISDTQLGFLLGAGFAIVYSVAGLPIASWVDRGPRVKIIVGGAIVWSAMTVLAAFADDFRVFALCRIGLAIGEAALTPAVISIIADLFPREKRALPTSLYVSMGSLMVTGALVFGAIALDVAQWLEPMLDLAPWRIALILCGLPGILIALLLLLTVREPQRGLQVEDRPAAALGGAGIRTLLDHLSTNRRFYLPFFAGDALAMTFAFAVATWMPTIVIRSFGLSASDTGYMLGAFGIPMTLLATFFWPAAIGWLTRRGRGSPVLLCLICGLALAAPLMVAMPLVPALWMVLAIFAVGKIPMATPTIMPPLAIQGTSPVELRGRMIAVHLIMVNLVGFSLGPLLVPVIAGFWPGDPDALRWSLSFMAATAIPAAVILFILARRHSPRPLPSG